MPKKICSHWKSFCSRVFAGRVGKPSPHQKRRDSRLVQLNQQNTGVLGALLCKCSGLVTGIKCECNVYYI